MGSTLGEVKMSKALAGPNSVMRASLKKALAKRKKPATLPQLLRDRAIASTFTNEDSLRVYLGPQKGIARSEPVKCPVTGKVRLGYALAA
jgi:hypothetical protein